MPRFVWATDAPHGKVDIRAATTSRDRQNAEVSLLELERQRQAASPPVAVAASLPDLKRSVTGSLETPLWIDCQQQRTYDLSIPRRTKSFYEVVLREARNAVEPALFLDEKTLVELWPLLSLPDRIHDGWEECHPRLRRRMWTRRRSCWGS